MRFLPVLLALFLFVFALPTEGLAMGSGPHPNVPYGIPYAPAHGARFITAATVGPDAISAAAPSIWDHPIYVIALGIAGGELLLGGLMVIGKATRSDEED